jgi:putative ABC transport system permease protein
VLVHYFHLALRSFGRNRVLTALMVLTIALGIGTSMTTITVYHVLSGDPIPHKSSRLFHVQLDPEPVARYRPGIEPLGRLTRLDAEALLAQARAPRQAMMAPGTGAIAVDGSATRPFKARLRYTTADFFPMFDVPFLHGRGWSAEDDAARTRTAVISRELNERLFGGRDSTGAGIRIDGHALRVAGVVDGWAPKPKFYDSESGHFDGEEHVFVPLSTALDLGLEHFGSSHCYGDVPVNDTRALNAPCVWLHYWVELADAADAGDYLAYLGNYSAQQQAAGRFERPANVRLRDVRQWLDHRRAVPGDVRMQLWLAMGFLVVCLINTVGLLLAKFLRRSGEIGVRRALGASRLEIFKQYMVEAGTIGVAGGALGLVLASVGLWAVRQRPASYASLAHMDLAMLLLTFVLALCASLLAGLLPAWKAMQVAPAIQLKSQ